MAIIAPLFLVQVPAVSSPVGSLDLANYKGKVVYLDFWASWCGPCRQSFPFMQQLQSRYGDEGLVVLAVNLDHSPELAAKFLQDVGAGNLDIVYDSERELARSYGVRDMPTSVLIGRDGRVRFTHQGFFPEQRSAYYAHVSELIHEH